MRKVIERTIVRNEQILLTCPYITIAGDIIQIENYKKIFKCTEKEIIILFTMQKNDIKIEGKKLEAILITSYVIRIRGDVIKISYINKT